MGCESFMLAFPHPHHPFGAQKPANIRVLDFSSMVCFPTSPASLPSDLHVKELGSKCQTYGDCDVGEYCDSTKKHCRPHFLGGVVKGLHKFARIEAAGVVREAKL